MTVTLAALVADRDLGLRLLTGNDDVEVSWTHSSDLLDPTPFLERDNLLLTTGTQFPPASGITAYAGYVDRLVGIGIAALGFGTEVVRTTPDPLITTCRQLGLPLLEIPYRTPFIAVARRIADERDAQAHARDRWALDSQRALSLAALSAERISGVLAELSRRLAATVLLLDANGQVVSQHGRPLAEPQAESVHTEALRLLRRRLRSGSALEVGGRTIQLQTLGRRSALRGVLAVGPQRRPDAATTTVITSAVALAEFALEDSVEREESTRARNAELAQKRLQPLLATADGSELLRALQTWLHHNAAWDPAARELGMHRHSLKARVRRAGSLLGLDLETFAGKAELWALLAVLPKLPTSSILDVTEG